MQRKWNFTVLSGNAMGYVRMIRSGGLHCCSSAIRYNRKSFKKKMAESDFKSVIFFKSHQWKHVYFCC